MPTKSTKSNLKCPVSGDTRGHSEGETTLAHSHFRPHRPTFLKRISQITSASDSDTHDYVPPGFDDVRCSCPALNALANHSFINHDGRAITFPQLTQALQSVYGISPSFATSLATRALYSENHPGDFSKPIDLHNIRPLDAISLLPTDPLLPYLLAVLTTHPDSQSPHITDFHIFEALRIRQAKFNKTAAALDAVLYRSRPEDEYIKVQLRGPMFCPHFVQHLEWAMTMEVLEPKGGRTLPPNFERGMMLGFLMEGRLPERVVKGCAPFGRREVGRYVEMGPLELDLLIRWVSFMDATVARRDRERRNAREGRVTSMSELVMKVAGGMQILPERGSVNNGGQVDERTVGNCPSYESALAKLEG